MTWLVLLESFRSSIARSFTGSFQWADYIVMYPGNNLQAWFLGNYVDDKYKWLFGSSGEVFRSKQEFGSLNKMYLKRREAVKCWIDLYRWQARKRGREVVMPEIRQRSKTSADPWRGVFKEDMVQMTASSIWSTLKGCYWRHRSCRFFPTKRNKVFKMESRLANYNLAFF